MQREQLHPTRVDADQRPVGARGQAGHGPVKAFGRARDWDAGFAVGAEDFEDVLRLRPLEQLLEAGGVFEALFEGFGAFGGVGQACLAFQPRALLLGIEELAQAFDGTAVRKALKGAH